MRVPLVESGRDTPLDAIPADIADTFPSSSLNSSYFLCRCIRERLVGGEGFAVDASLIKADANRQKGIEGETGLPPDAGGQAVEEYLAVLDDAAFGAATEVAPKFVSPADPAAR